MFDSKVSISYLSQFFLSIILVFFLTWILEFMRFNLSTPVIALLFLVPVVISAGYFNITGGITASFAAFLSFNYFFIPPYHTLAVHQTQDIIALIVFLVVAVIISQSLSQAKIGMATAVARERETTILYELNVALAGSTRENDILQIVGEKIIEHFPVDLVVISLRSPQRPVLTQTFPQGAHHPERNPDGVLSVSGGEENFGEIKIWTSQELDHPQMRLLRAFGSQATLVLEKAFLANAQNRARLLEESDKLKSTLLSSVSHELRTPLSTIKASVSSLRSGEIEWDSEARKELLTAVEEESDHLNLLVGNLLDMSRIEMGALQPNQKNYSLREIVSATVRRLRQSLSHHTVIIQIPENLPLVNVDYSQMDQVFSNLLSNSAKYAPEGTRITIDAHELDESMIQVRVTNQGPPVAKEHLTRIFDKFYRVTDAAMVTGTGLGLSICKGIIEAHHGTIWAENTSDGLTFKFTIPIARRKILLTDADIKETE
jgi:two-component system, OmpR family, sensor histidine kinase KdpD